MDENYEVNGLEFIKQLADMAKQYTDLVVEYATLAQFIQDNLETVEKMNLLMGHLEQFEIGDSVKLLRIYKELLILTEKLSEKYKIETGDENDE